MKIVKHKYNEFSLRVSETDAETILEALIHLRRTATKGVPDDLRDLIDPLLEKGITDQEYYV